MCFCGLLSFLGGACGPGHLWISVLYPVCPRHTHIACHLCFSHALQPRPHELKTYNFHCRIWDMSSEPRLGGKKHCAVLMAQRAFDGRSFPRDLTVLRIIDKSAGLFSLLATHCRTPLSSPSLSSLPVTVATVTPQAGFQWKMPEKGQQQLSCNSQVDVM